MTKFIYPYQEYSKSVHELRKATGFKIIRLKDSKYVHGPHRTVINWGSSSLSLTALQREGPVLNPTNVVKTCANKSRFFDIVHEHARVPEFTTNRDVARGWAEHDLVIGRTILNGHSGQGIIFSDEDPDFWQKGLLFTKYIPKLKEFRVHVFQGRIIDTQQKKLRETDDTGQPVDKDNVNWRVRSYTNGFIFAREQIEVPQDVTAQALNAFSALRDLDFGAFDVIYNRRRDEAYVLECNTAPGLTGTTLDNYVEALTNA